MERIALAGWLTALCLLAYVMLLSSQENHQVPSGIENAYSYYCDTSSGARFEDPAGPADREGDPEAKKQRRYELCQQGRSAEAANVSAYWGKFQAILTVVGICFVAVTTYYAALSANAAANAANAALKSAKISEDALTGLERPYLFANVKGVFNIVPRKFRLGIGDTSVEVFEGRVEPPRIEVTLKNYGRLPAIPTMLSLTLSHLTSPPDEIRHVDIVDFNPNTVIESGHASIKFVRNFGKELDEVDQSSLVNARSFLWAYGLITYRSPTGGTYETEFFWCWNGLASQFAPYGTKHNRMT